MSLFNHFDTNQDTIPVAPPKGTPPPPAGELLEDVRMAEAQAPVSSNDTDAQMNEVEPVKPVEPVVDSTTTHEPSNGLTNGHTHESQSHVPSPSPASISPAVPSSETAVDNLAASSPYPNNTIPNEHVDDKPPPAKRARKYSDAEQASLANVSLPSPCTPLRAC